MARARQTKAEPREETAPDQRPLTELAAARLGALAQVEAKELTGRPIAELSDRFRWKIDPELLFFRRVCGQVVKKDPATGNEYPVPLATVHVEDMDCGLLGFFPGGWPFGWYFPLFCRREEIATVTTDECGRFCVFIPRFEIDWILRFRRRRICFPIIFERPRLVDILERLPKPMSEWPPRKPPRPFPDPDPEPFLLENGGLALHRAEDLLGRAAAERLGADELGGALGGHAELRSDLLSEPLSAKLFPPPLPPELAEKLHDGKGIDALAGRLEQVSGAQLDRIGPLLQRVDPRLAIGPFWRCRDVFVPEWVPILDVPDVTFSVTQDVDGDGDDETIYSEGYFDVRWDAGPIPPVKLEASQIALAGVSCDRPDVPCEDEPAIVLAGLMPLHNPSSGDPYHDNGTGYARRPNRPHPSALFADPPPNPLPTTPFAGTLQLYGCAHGLGAQFYRLRYSFGGGAQVPFLGHSWKLFRLGPGGVLQVLNVVPDAAGWYGVINPADNWLPSHLLLNWPTTAYESGLYEIVLELGNAAKSVVNTSDPIRIRVDNSNPTAIFSGLAWRPAGSGAWTNVGLSCPTIFRSAGQAIELKVSYQASAQHLRSLQLSAGGCGGVAPAQLPPPTWSDPPAPAFDAGVSQSPYEHWHTGPLDNALARAALFSLGAAAPQGSYGFSLFVASRAFNPAGGNGGVEADWNYDPVVRWTPAHLSVAVVDT